MSIAALIMFVVAALGGFYLLGTWLRGGGMRQQAGGTTRFPAWLIFGHFLLAATALVLWIIYVAVDAEGLSWATFVVLAVVALLGFTMFARWLPVRRAPAPAGEAPAERGLPTAAVVGHGLSAAVTLVLVLLVALGVGGS